jgi:hypothetical protein
MMDERSPGVTLGFLFLRGFWANGLSGRGAVVGGVVEGGG